MKKAIIEWWVEYDPGNDGIRPGPFPSTVLRKCKEMPCSHLESSFRTRS